MNATILSLVRLVAFLTAINLAAVGIAVLLNSLAYAQPGRSSVAQLPPQQKSGKAANAETKSPMRRCIDSWDRGTQMSKQEWKETCKRTVKLNPDLYAKPY